MHTADSDSENAGNDHTLPKSTDPLFLAVEEQRHGDGTSANRDDTCCNDVMRRIGELVVGSAEVAYIVHAHDRETSKHSGNDVQKPASNGRLEPKFCNVEGKTKSDHRQKARKSCVTGAVGHLEVVLAFCEHDGAIADEMHTPDANETHGQSTAQQLHATDLSGDYIAYMMSPDHSPTRPRLAGTLAVE